MSAQAGEEVDGLLVECGSCGAGGLGDGREGLSGTGLGPSRRRRSRLRVGAAGVGRLSPVARLVAGDRSGDDAAGGRADAFAAQVAVGLQLAQGGGDPRGAFLEAGSEALDVHRGAGGERLDVAAEADRQERQLLVLGEVVADHHEAGGVAGVLVDDAAGVVTRSGRIAGGG
ncbi:hypothetical protein FHS32_003949 [Streptomyces albaduncus]|uniref:Uncharacterized protein n=1 Tax=Streptomyces griseoloalbus TaxID=67303 RepID=A0A7W8BPI8_9ACTN|nr:hypothetical protein [Streptomyces albaduncus]GGW44828.1 hypothetical protein GCM10010340_23640 [Streptomyces albaduncus]